MRVRLLAIACSSLLLASGCSGDASTDRLTEPTVVAGGIATVESPVGPTSIPSTSTPAPPPPTNTPLPPPPPINTPVPPSPVAPRSNCNPNYSGACLDQPGDYDCASGSGNGPNYTGPVRVVGSDPYDLDRDHDGYGCE